MIVVTEFTGVHSSDFFRVPTCQPDLRTLFLRGDKNVGIVERATRPDLGRYFVAIVSF